MRTYEEIQNGCVGLTRDQDAVLVFIYTAIFTVSLISEEGKRS